DLRRSSASICCRSSVMRAGSAESPEALVASAAAPGDLEDSAVVPSPQPEITALIPATRTNNETRWLFTTFSPSGVAGSLQGRIPASNAVERIGKRTRSPSIGEHAVRSVRVDAKVREDPIPDAMAQTAGSCPSGTHQPWI